MKFTGAIVGALAAVATALPTQVEERGFNFDASLFNNFQNFGSNNVDFNYFLGTNAIDLQFLGLLANQGFNINQFGGLFDNNNVGLNVQDLLLLQQIQDLQFIFQAGLFQNFALDNFGFNQFNLGVLDQNIGQFGLNSLILDNQFPAIQQVVATVIAIKE